MSGNTAGTTTSSQGLDVLDSGQGLDLFSALSWPSCRSGERIESKFGQGYYLLPRFSSLFHLFHDIRQHGGFEVQTHILTDSGQETYQDSVIGSTRL